jgi:hypothetical protein
MRPGFGIGAFWHHDERIGDRSGREVNRRSQAITFGGKVESRPARREVLRRRHLPSIDHDARRGSRA